MSKWLSVAITSLLLLLALAACSVGGDDDADPTATGTSGAAVIASATSTSTPAAGGGDAEPSPSATRAASPTVERTEPTPTVGGTAPLRPIATQPPTQPAATATSGGATGIPEVEAQLMTALLQPEDFTGDWTQDTFGPMEEDTDDSDELCGQPPFPDRDQRIAGVEAEYTLEAAEPAFVIHNIVLFPEETAIDALAYARDISSCGQWTDEDGQTYTIQPLEGSEYGDESYTASIAFEIDGTPFSGEYTFVRIGGAIATVAFIVIEGSDVSAFPALVDVAAERLAEVEAGSGSTGEDLLDLLLVAEDIALIDSVNVWDEGELTDAGDDERYSLCGSEPFPDALGAVAEIGRQMSADAEVGPSMLHGVIQMNAGDGATTMEWIRAEFSCPSWSDEDGDYEISDRGELDLGDDTYWLILDGTAPDGSGRTFQAGLGFTQIDDIISVVVLVQEGGIDLELFGAILALGAQKVIAGTPT